MRASIITWRDGMSTVVIRFCIVRQVLGDLADDELVRARVDDDPRARRSDLAQQRRELRGACVRELEAERRQLHAEALFFFQPARGRGLGGDALDRADAHHVPFEENVRLFWRRIRSSA